MRFKGNIDPDTWSRSVIPPAERPYGLVIETRSFRTGNKPEYAGQVEIAMVRWFNPKWNTRGDGCSEEMMHDLEIVQRSAT